MTPAEQKAWLAGREAVCREADRIAGNTADFGRDYRRAAGQVAAMGRALTPPSAPAWTPPEDRGKMVKPKPGAPAGGYGKDDMPTALAPLPGASHE